MVKCKNCRGIVKFPFRVFCSKECRINYYNRNKNKKRAKEKINVCTFCHNKFKSKNKNPKFCSQRCGENFRRLRNRIYRIFPFQHEKAEKEIKRLEKLGINYSFPKPHQDLNLFYQLGDHKNA